MNTCPLWLERKCNRSNCFEVKYTVSPLILMQLLVKGSMYNSDVCCLIWIGVIPNSLDSHSTASSKTCSSLSDNEITSNFPHNHHLILYNNITSLTFSVNIVQVFLLIIIQISLFFAMLKAPNNRYDCNKNYITTNSKWNNSYFCSIVWNCIILNVVDFLK